MRPRSGVGCRAAAGSRHRSFEVGLNTFPVTSRQPGSERLDPLIVLLDFGPMPPNYGLVPLGLVLHPSLPCGLIDVVLSPRALELRTCLGNAALVTRAPAEQAA